MQVRPVVWPSEILGRRDYGFLVSAASAAFSPGMPWVLFMQGWEGKVPWQEHEQSLSDCMLEVLRAFFSERLHADLCFLVMPCPYEVEGDWFRPRYREYLSADLLPLVAHRFGLSADWRRRAFIGHSRGAFHGFDLALQGAYFKHCIAVNGAGLPLAWKLSGLTDYEGPTAFHFFWGDQDPYRSDCRQLQARLRETSLELHTATHPGGHSLESASASLAAGLAILAGWLRSVPTQKNIAA